MKQVNISIMLPICVARANKISFSMNPKCSAILFTYTAYVYIRFLHLFMLPYPLPCIL